MTKSVAIVGAGISGLTAAYVLRSSRHVTVFEADDRLGGHAHTHTISDAIGEHQVDSGFIVHNNRTYPQLQRLFAELGVRVHATEMSMSISCDGCGLQFAGGRKLRGMFAQRRRLVDLQHLKLLFTVTRFQRAARVVLDSSADNNFTLGDFVREHGWSEHFIHHYVIAVVSCVWSTGAHQALDYPARYLFEFLDHHGFLSIRDAPQWYTVVGGSRRYVDALRSQLVDVRTNHRVVAIARDTAGVTLTDEQGQTHRFDSVVVATHADEALQLLADATTEEKRILGAFEYSVNDTVLHSDAAVLPSAPDAQSSWNYRMPSCSASQAKPVVSYWMNRLHGIESEKPFIVTLNGDTMFDQSTSIARMRYTHPVYTSQSVAAQRELDSLSTQNTVFAGAYHGWGFHEDGCRSGLRAAERLGASW